MKISYSMLVHNETDTLEKLLKFLVKWKHEGDEIVILDDYSDNEKTKEILDFYVSTYDIVYEQRNLLKDFASQKNYLKNMGSGDYSFNLDADEMISLWMIKNVHEIIEANEGIDLIYLPRVNTVEGLTKSHIDKWRWNVDDKGRVNWPDYQTRIYKNTDDILWMNKVHERITGYDTFSNFPADENYCLYHHKQIKKQEKQNEFYETI